MEGSAPIYDLYKKYNIDPIDRLLKLAKECGVKHAAICGSYFSYFAKTMPELELTKRHPYIRSRIDQEEAAIAFADEGFSVGVLEPPYIFGTQPGRKPVWMFVAQQILSAKGPPCTPRAAPPWWRCIRWYMPKLAKIQCNELFIDKSLGCVLLGAEEDGIDSAIGDSVRLHHPG